jgi:hypothetical protein
MSREKYAPSGDCQNLSSAVVAFVRGEADTSNFHVSSDGTALMRKGVVIAWWAADEIYMMLGPDSPAATWLNQLHAALGHDACWAFSPTLDGYTYLGRPIGPDEVIKLELP